MVEKVERLWVSQASSGFFFQVVPGYDLLHGDLHLFRIHGVLQKKKSGQQEINLENNNTID
jgi:hypothetical protein